MKYIQTNRTLFAGGKIFIEGETAATDETTAANLIAHGWATEAEAPQKGKAKGKSTPDNKDGDTDQSGDGNGETDPAAGAKSDV